ncbi:hypothetical protein [Rickettsia australis]|uniref:hypothetical protein n=1 Tax=Rickettsia australis TaxID=787 RepID=UPI0002EC25FB|nr:hypothetical protein [Rickettsia australis]
MHYLSYKWGQGNLWNNKFDYVFRVKLKALLSNWTLRYGTNIDDDILSCFIHYCLDSKDIKLEDIKNIQDKDRILLLHYYLTVMMRWRFYHIAIVITEILWIRYFSIRT